MAKGTAAERLPKQHPSRFAANDSLRDGQASLSSAAPPPSPQPPDREATLAYISHVFGIGLRPTTRDEHRNERSKDIQASLPPLTSSVAIDEELYALIAAVLHQYVQSWYSKITADQQFMQEVAGIIAHAVQQLETRLAAVDLQALLLDELPRVISEHIQTVRIARSSSGLQMSLTEQRSRFHALRPHVALHPVPDGDEAALAQEENETAWSLLLVDRILPLLLPPEDLQNPCLNILLTELVAELGLRRGLCGKVSEGWFLWESITKLVYVARPDLQRQRTSRESVAAAAPVNRLEKFGLLDSLQSEKSPMPPRTRPGIDAMVATFWRMMQVMGSIFLVLRSTIAALTETPPPIPVPTSTAPTSSPEQPLHERDGDSSSNTLKKTMHNPTATHAPMHEMQTGKQPILGMQIWSLILHLLSLGERMPWLTGMLLLLQRILLYGPGQVGGVESRLDSLASAHLHALLHANAPIWLPALLRSTRSALFPSTTTTNPPPPSPSPSPSPAAIAHIQQTCADALLDSWPWPFAARVFFATAERDAMRADVQENLLALWEDGYVNKHLLVRVLEVALCRVFPELLDPSPAA